MTIVDIKQSLSLAVLTVQCSEARGKLWRHGRGQSFLKYQYASTYSLTNHSFRSKRQTVAPWERTIFLKVPIIMPQLIATRIIPSFCCSLSPDITMCGWLGPKHQPDNCCSHKGITTRIIIIIISMFSTSLSLAGSSGRFTWVTKEQCCTNTWRRFRIICW